MSAAAKLAGAAPNGAPDWHSINWKKVWRTVRRLQARIVKAIQEGRWNKVQSLVYLLTHSYSGRALAILRVTENSGAKTPGVDGETWNTPAAKADAFNALRRHGYQPQPLRRAYIPKSNGKQRPLGIPTMKDRAMQALYLLGLDPIAETLADNHSFGFRLERCCADALEYSFLVLGQPTRKCPSWVLEGDIKACFDRIDHEWLLKHIPMDKEVLRKWLKAGYLEKHVLFATTDGTPQGGLSPPFWRTGLWMDCKDCWRSTLTSRKTDRKQRKSTWLAMRMTSLSPAHPSSFWNMKSDLSWHASWQSGVSNSPTRKPRSRISRTASISWDRT
jgi:RNA-directed DNA polymerase